MPEVEYPDPALLASIEHQAEKLGYLVAQVEEMFRNHARHDHQNVLFDHAIKSAEMTKRWIASEISDSDYAANSSTLIQSTSDIQDQIRMVHQKNLNRLNAMVAEAIERGKSQQNELNVFLDGVLGDEN